MPIGSQAKYEPITPGGLDLTAGLFVFPAWESHQLFHAQSDDPLRDIAIDGNPLSAESLRIPAAVPFGFGGPDTIHIVAPDGFTVHEIIDGRPDGDGKLTAVGLAKTDLRGSGIPPEFISPNGSGLTRLAGSLHRQELQSGIHRVIGAVASVEAISLNDRNEAHIWPAVASPKDAGYRHRFRPLGNVQIGSLLAIPPEVDLSTLGLGAHGPAIEIARALQDYGLYIKECVDWQPRGKPGLIICVNGDSAEPIWPDLDRLLDRVALHLRVVVNNGPKSMGGGGTPRQPLAPDFSDRSP